MTAADKEWIDSSSYEVLLKLWRHAEPGHHMFVAETGDHYYKTMKKKGEKVGHDERVSASKSVGW